MNTAQPIRLLLTAEQAEQLRNITADAPIFFAAGRASHPDHNTLALHLIEAESMDAVNKAASVALGELGTRKMPAVKSNPSASQ